jgi:hypothetical protein
LDVGLCLGTYDDIQLAMTILGNPGLASARRGGGATANPYEAIAGLTSFFAPDNAAKVQWVPSGSVFAVNSRSSTERLNFMSPTSFVEAWSPTISAINGSRLAFHFAAASTQSFVQPNAVNDIVDDDGSLTVFAVLRTAIGAGGAWIYGKGQAASGGRRWALSQSDVGDGRLQFGINGTNNGNPDAKVCRSDASISDGTLRRAICIYNPANAPDATMTMYIDGVLQADNANVVVGPLRTTSDRLAIGGTNEIGDYWDGWLTDIGSYNRALVDPAEIAKLDAIMLKRTT